MMNKAAKEKYIKGEIAKWESLMDTAKDAETRDLAYRQVESLRGDFFRATGKFAQ